MGEELGETREGEWRRQGEKREWEERIRGENREERSGEGKGRKVNRKRGK